MSDLSKPRAEEPAAGRAHRASEFRPPRPRKRVCTLFVYVFAALCGYLCGGTVAR